VDSRPGYRALMAAAMSPCPSFDFILVEDLSRLTREIPKTINPQAERFQEERKR
jgi:hypothetical protein